MADNKKQDQQQQSRSKVFLPSEDQLGPHGEVPASAFRLAGEGAGDEDDAPVRFQPDTPPATPGIHPNATVPLAQPKLPPQGGLSAITRFTTNAADQLPFGMDKGPSQDEIDAANEIAARREARGPSVLDNEPEPGMGSANETAAGLAAGTTGIDPNDLIQQVQSGDYAGAAGKVAGAALAFLPNLAGKIAGREPYLQHAQNLASLIDQNGGATYSLKHGDMTGTRNYAVSMHPERSLALDPTQPATPQIAQWMAENQDLLHHPQAAAEGRRGPDGRMYLEVSGTTPVKDNALALGQRHNQVSIYDLMTGRDIPTGGTGGVTDAPQGDPYVKAGAAAYNEAHGLPTIKGTYLQTAENAPEIANAYENAQHEPQNPRVQRSYNALKKDIDSQWAWATGPMGVQFEPWTKPGQPYHNSSEMRADVANNHHLYYFQGGEMPADHPLAETSPQTGETYNNMFRAVHDLFGHAMSGFEFGPRGEENAWHVHSQMMSPEALPAMTTETRGQNSFVNFGRHLQRPDGTFPVKGDPDYVPQSQRPYAEQKATVLPYSATSRGELMRHEGLAPGPDKQPFAGTHFSDTAKLDLLSGSRRGSSKIGKEANRLAQGAATGENAIPGVYAYRRGTLPEPAIGARKYEYGVNGNYALADLASPEIQSQWEKIKQDAPDAATAFNRLEHRVRELGYDGYYSSSFYPDSVFLFGDHPATPAGIKPGIAAMADQLAAGGSAASQRGSAPLGPGGRVRSSRILGGGPGGGPGPGGPEPSAAVRAPRSIAAATAPRQVSSPTGPAAVPSTDANEILARNLLTKAGMNWNGKAGFASVGMPEAYLATDPVTKSTLAFPESDLNPDSINQTIINSRKKFVAPHIPNLDSLDLPTKKKLGEIIPPQTAQDVPPHVLNDVLSAQNPIARAKAMMKLKGKLAPLDQLAAVARRGFQAKDWYDKFPKLYDQLSASAPDIFPASDKQTFADFVAALSPRTGVDRNFADALEHWARWIQADRPRGTTQLYDLFNDVKMAGSRRPNMVRALQGENLSGYKVGSFAGDLTDKDNGTIDTWMSAGMSKSPLKLDRPEVYGAVTAHMADAARMNGWNKKQTQAAIWSYNRLAALAGGFSGASTSPKPPGALADVITPDLVKKYSSDGVQIFRDALTNPKTKDQKRIRVALTQLLGTDKIDEFKQNLDKIDTDNGLNSSLPVGSGENDRKLVGEYTRSLTSSLANRQDIKEHLQAKEQGASTAGSTSSLFDRKAAAGRASAVPAKLSGAVKASKTASISRANKTR